MTCVDASVTPDLHCLNMEYTDLRYLDGNTITLDRPEGASDMRAIIEGDRCVLGARLRRAFPLSHPDRYFSLQDGEGKEVGILRSLDELDHASRRVAEQEIDWRYFTPKILRLNSVKQEGGLWTFDVLTSRGPIQFYVRNWRDSSSEIAPGRFLIQSVDGQRFEIEDYSRLDTASQVLIEQLF